MILRLFVLSLVFSETLSLMCYHCSETTEDINRNRCSRWIRTMNRYRQISIETGSPNRYVKNCTGFRNLAENEIFCIISRIEIGGNVRSYIRGCGDGTDFFSGDYNDDIVSLVQSDNQTACIYTGQGYVACAQYCQSDFCNGYVSKATPLDFSYHVLFVSLLVYFFLTFQYQTTKF